jgi:carboxypeptidase C (cathepsin A)
MADKITENIKEVTEKADVQNSDWSGTEKCFSSQHTFGSGCAISEKFEYHAVVSQILLDADCGKKPKSAKMGFTSFSKIHSVSHAEADSLRQKRPLVFLFNGGPGSASFWLNVGAFGPFRVSGLDVSDDPVDMSLIENEHSLLPHADLVFIDPIGTGFSEVMNDEIEKYFLDEVSDAQSVAEFIAQYLGRHDGWARPIVIAGESYGGYRASLATERLIDQFGIYPSGLLFVAPFLSGVSIEEVPENAIARMNFFKTFAVTAWYHKKSSLNVHCKTVEQAYEAAHQIVFKDLLTDFVTLNLKDWTMESLQKISVAIGIAPEVLKREGNAFYTHQFSKELLNPLQQYVGRLDSRYVLASQLDFSKGYSDPSLHILNRKIVTQTNALYFGKLQVKYSHRYKHSSETVSKQWIYKNSFFASAFSAVKLCLEKNPQMRIYAATGYYDLAVPAATVDYDFSHLGFSSDSRVKHVKYPAGHMVYVHEETLKKLSEDVRAFLL